MKRNSSAVLGLSCAALLIACVAGCGMQAGTLFYFLGAGRLHTVEAEFALTEGPLLILVDDLNERLTWGPARDRIAEELAKELLEHEAAAKIIAPQTLKRHRRTQAGFDDLKCTQVGRLVGADQVLWIDVQAFYAEEEVHDTTQAASLAVTVRVINPNERKDRAKVRLWPSNREESPQDQGPHRRRAGPQAGKGNHQVLLQTPTAGRRGIDKPRQWYREHTDGAGRQLHAIRA